MLKTFDAANEWLKRRESATTRLSSREIAANVPPRVRAACFFSARVSEARIVEALRAVSDHYSAGRVTLAEARTHLKRFLATEGYTPGGVGSPPPGVDPKAWGEAQKITNLASTARLNLILRQNAAMAAAVGTYEVGQDPDIKERWPYWRYIALHDARGTHAALNNVVVHKDDPFWHRHFPPWEFNCRCQVEDCDAAEAGQYGGPVTFERYPPAPESGFAFDPADAFAQSDMGRVLSPQLREEICQKLLDYCAETNSQTVLLPAPDSNPVPARLETPPPPVASEISADVSAQKEREIGAMAPGINRSLGLKPSPVKTDGGTVAGGLDAVATERALRATLWNPAATAKVEVRGKEQTMTVTGSGAVAILALIAGYWVLRQLRAVENDDFTGGFDNDTYST